MLSESFITIIVVVAVAAAAVVVVDVGSIYGWFALFCFPPKKIVCTHVVVPGLGRPLSLLLECAAFHPPKRADNRNRCLEIGSTMVKKEAGAC